MAADAGLVGSLVDRLATRLPHRTGTGGLALSQDDILNATRVSIVQLARTSVDLVLEALVTLLEGLSRPYNDVTTHPTHVFLSEVYVLALTAESCSASWAVHTQNAEAAATDPAPLQPLDAVLVGRTLDALKALIDPLPENFHIPSHTLLDQPHGHHPAASSPLSVSASPADWQSQTTAESLSGDDSAASRSSEIDHHVKTVVQYVTASSWTPSFDHLRTVFHGIRTTTSSSTTADSARAMLEADRGALATLRLLASFWVDGNKLSLITQEICSSYLHFRRSYQNVIAVVTPLLIHRWIDRHPEEFVQLHQFQRRFEGGADTLFDMTHTVTDNTRRRSLLYPLQSSLLFLLPDVFEVASNLKEARSSSMMKKVALLDALRKALRNGNDQAAWSLVSLLRASRHFDIESDSALVSYAMDVQDEVRDAMFRRTASAMETTPFEGDMMTAAFVSLAHLHLDATVSTLVEGCIASTAPNSFKIAAIRGCSYFVQQRHSWRCKELFGIMLPFMRKQLNAACAEPFDVQERPGSKSENLVCSILRFLEASPDRLRQDAPQDSMIEPFLLCVLSPNPTVRQLATAVADRLFRGTNTDSEDGFIIDSPALRKEIWARSSRVILGLCERISAHRQEAELYDLHEYLKARLLILKHVPELSQIPGDIPDVVTASSRLETMLLVSLCSANVETCRLVTSCIGAFLQECNIVNKYVEAAKSSASVLRNGDIFREIASPGFRFTGLVAFQKRIRTLLRRMQYPTTAILNAWEAAFDRWIHLSKDVSSASESVDDRVLSEWRNYSGFLASLGGICVADQAIILEEPALGGLRWIDRLPSENYEEPPLTRYLRLSTQLLGCANVRVREAMREVLANEVASTLYQQLFRAIETELEVLFAGALAPVESGQDSEVIFAEQSASLLRALVEKLQTPAELGAASSVHLGSVTLNFAKFLDGITDTADTLRVKIRVCQLCEIVTKRKEHLNLRDDVHIRNQLLEYIFGWITRPRSPFPDQPMSSSRHDDLSRIRKDVDRACLKALGDVTFRLPLQPSDSQTDAGMSEMKSQMFHTYFNRFLSLLNHETGDSGRSEVASSSLNREDAVTNSELAITILSNLLSANIDVGLKHSLNIGYHENVEIRTAFVKVLYNILIQGTEFSNLTDSAVSEKYEELLDLLTRDLSLSAAMASICPSNEVEELTVCLLTVFEQRGMTFQLMEMLIKQEINQTVNEAEILRRTCVATKMLSVYAKWKGAPYLKGTLGKVLERLMLTSQDLDLELDPTRVNTAEELQKNALQLRIVAKVFIDDICASSTHIPLAFRKICNIISEAVQPKFPDAKYTAVGAFVFLRFFCPAIVAPEVEGLVSNAPSKEMRRGLLLIAKVIQNLANNVLFGAKEPYMFPLNHFLTQNIYRVTTFLREICVLTDELETRTGASVFDFGSCVALHRFLYDHWDHVRQTLVSRERRDFVRSPSEMTRGRSPTLEPLRNLIANLGPPPLGVSWNRPQISANSPPLYARFQNFMLTNAFRGSESVTTSRAVYDGGESKDGYSIICIILRHIESESIDYETLLFCYLKIASRLWQKPFGLFIDATCYNGRNEPQDALFKMLELLAPAELARNLARIYVYNMNNPFKRCFRRLLRISTRNDDSIFHPNNVEYHLIGSLQDLQTHFHLSQLHLPKETISVVTDTRYVFQPITRLSKSKGKIEVVIKVGSQFVQITTTMKQEVFAGFRLHATINDIFRLGDVDEAATSIQTEDDSAFGLRADGGKLIMYFTSPKKVDILQSIQKAQAKYGKDARAQKPLERLIRPQDVPGTLLNLALTNLASPDQSLRLSSYNLLGALCKAFKFESAARLACTKDLFVPADASRFVVDISRDLARTEPQLTADFLTEFFVGWDSFPDEQKPLSLAYMAPWLPGLRTHVLAAEPDSEKARERVAALFVKLIDLAISDHALGYTLVQVVWPAIGQDEVLLEIFLDELLKTALEFSDAQQESIENVSSVLMGIGTITLRGKVLSRLRKAINRSSHRPTKSLPDHPIWSEICVMLKLCVALSFNDGVQAQLFLPEVFHVVTMLSNTGGYNVRQLVYKLLINTVHAMCTSFILDELKGSKLRATMEMLSEPRADLYSAPPGFSRDGASISTAQDSGPALAAVESLAATLYEVCTTAAPSVDMANAWRSRWMSLVTSTAFQVNPAIQPRAFTVMGSLAREEVDDDLLYQVLVALRNGLNQFGEDASTDMLLATITSLSKMMAKLPSASRYGLQLFWLAMSLVRLVPASLFNCTALFLDAVLTNIGTVGGAKGDKMVPLLLQGREPLQEAALLLDDAYGVHFNEDSFHYAVCACLARGLTDTMTRSTTLNVLSSFLEMTTWSSEPEADRSASTSAGLPYLTLLRARAASGEELKDTSWPADGGIEGGDGATGAKDDMDIDLVKDGDLLLIAAIKLVDFQYLEDSVQVHTLTWLNKLAENRPEVVANICGGLRPILEEVLLHGQSAATLQAAHSLLTTLTSHKRYSKTVQSPSSVTEALDEMGFGGLWRSCSVGSMEGTQRECFQLTVMLIEMVV